VVFGEQTLEELLDEQSPDRAVIRALLDDLSPQTTPWR
jgi:hypothetical protein